MQTYALDNRSIKNKMSLQKPIEAAKKNEEPINRLKDHKVEGVVLHILPQKMLVHVPATKIKT